VSRFALVTGAAGDLGRAAAIRLADEGWSLFLADHSSAAERLEAVRVECARSDADAVAVTFDVTDAAAVEFGIEALANQYGVPAALVASAGVQGEFAPVLEYEPASVRRVLEVNVIGVFNCVRVVARLLIRGHSEGSVVALASMAGVNGAPNMPAYSASKAAVIGLVKSAARDLAPHGIRVNAVSPGFIGPGAMWDNQVAQQASAGSRYFAREPSAVARQMIGSIPLGRYGSPGEVADLIAYLVGDRSSYMTGINVEVSGGAF
jgi:NAD(P)-dependent dehydrogenase (short-subunit alcohol dehydrogenase family)